MFDNSDIWVAVLSAVLGGGFINAIVSAWRAKSEIRITDRRTYIENMKSEADATDTISNAASKLVLMLDERLSRQEAELTNQAKQIRDLNMEMAANQKRMRDMESQLEDGRKREMHYRMGIKLLTNQILQISDGKIEPVFYLEETTASQQKG